MSQSRQGRNGGALLSTSQTGRGHKDTGVFAPEATSGPLATGGVPEGLPLCGEVTITSRDTEKEGIVGGEGDGVDDRIL